MDVDAYVAAHHLEWARLERLINRSRKLSGIEIDEMVELYQRTATHLSVVRSASPDPVLVGRLSSLVARGQATVSGSHAPLWRDVGRFVTVSFPAAAYRLRWWWLSIAVISNLISLAVAIWIVQDPAVQASLGAPSMVRAQAWLTFGEPSGRTPATNRVGTTICSPRSVSASRPCGEVSSTIAVVPFARRVGPTAKRACSRIRSPGW